MLAAKHIRTAAVGAVGALTAVPLMAYLRGFLVDDAFITARYAANVAAGHGYRFNADGAVTDGVTPLGFVYLLVPFARGSGVAERTMAAFRASQLIGVVLWLVAMASVAVSIDRLEGHRGKWFGLVVAASSVPLAAWSQAGLDTGVVVSLAAMAVSARALGRERVMCVAASLVAGWRPEAIPFAVALALSPTRRPGARHARWFKLAAVCTPALIAAATRALVFGRAMPLSSIAKPPSLRLGIMYAVACALLCGLVAMVAVRDIPPWIRGLQAAVIVHFGAIALAGGDWMPVSRLATTALPALALVAAAVAARKPGPSARLSRALQSARGLAVLAAHGFVLHGVGASVAHTEAERWSARRALEPALREGERLAALDIGWLGATVDAPVVDLAGVTDPEVAVLPGGHTSKRIPPWFMDAREVDTIVLRLRRGHALATPFYTSRFATTVDMWVATTPQVAEAFEVVAEHEGEPHYIVLRRR